MPAALMREEPLPDELAPYLDAFFAAASGRQFTVAVTMSGGMRIPQMIPLAELIAAAGLYGLEPLRFTQIARVLDAAYIGATMQA